MPAEPRRTLAGLPEAFAAGLLASTGDARAALAGKACRSAVTVGSGASYSAAVYCARVLEESLGVHTSARYPYDYFSGGASTDAVVLFSARGKNRDALAAADRALADRAAPLIALCGDPTSALARRLEEYPDGLFVHVPRVSPVANEGFFGVESLAGALGGVAALWPRLADAIGSAAAKWAERACLRAFSTFEEDSVRAARLTEAGHLVVVGTHWACPAVVDFESKMVEAGLGWVEISDAKNFTHGRFMNSARRLDETAVLVFATREQERVVELISAGMGGDGVVVSVVSPLAGPLGGMDLLFQAQVLFEQFASRASFDPWQPELPSGARGMFKGRGLYGHLELQDTLGVEIEAAVVAKRESFEALAGPPPGELPAAAVPKAVVAASVSMLADRTFSGLVLDFDGTVVALGTGEVEIGAEMADALAQVLKQGIKIAVVTGRGRSTLELLRQSLAPSLHSAVHCYLYNGGALWRLDEPTERWANRMVDATGVVEAIHMARKLTPYVKDVDIGGPQCQVSIRLRSLSGAHTALRLVERAIKSVGRDDLVARTSGRSVDVTPAGTSKPRARDHFQDTILGVPFGPSVLSVGDRGEPGGNDHEMLRDVPSFSVGSVDWQPSHCFPVVDEEGQTMKGPTGTTYLLRHIRAVEGGSFQLRLGRMPGPAA